MIANIQEQFDSLTGKREELFQHLESLTSEELSFKAGPDKWSIVEVVEHLVIAEDDLLTQLTTEVPSPPLDIESKTPEKYQAVIKVMERDIKVDVPHESLEPHGRLTLDDLLNQWNDIQKKLQGILAAIHADNKDDLVYQHPYGGPLDISETLHFFDVHFDNHMRHIDRILAQTKR